MRIGTHRVQMCKKPNLKSLSQAHMSAQVSMHTSRTPPHPPTSTTSATVLSRPDFNLGRVVKTQP